jgi:hypothetical protein
VIFRLAVAAAARLFAAAMDFVDRRPRTPLCLVLGDAALFVSFFDVLGLTLFFLGVFGLVASGRWLRVPLSRYDK